ncbi:hypothetical protein PGT21_006959 [Puccinia graminis f. sp. tritici]|uniref:Uncharacterized protein n=1 Tax=Puccinia graminis f. sp. tritici TaxID=56615 RepID=A0A5B0N064_PUCGR|nr:hypothetical protein PGT21_006959 [Puccinia graminis f. sp. tritici]KAA1133548.1 hypothetical protein PGTUg99_023274 [Puccinia graminis f. sp. tritici]
MLSEPIFGSKKSTITNFIFNFFISPFTSTTKQQQQQQQQEQQEQEQQEQQQEQSSNNITLSKFFAQKNQEPLTENETEAVLALIKRSQPEQPKQHQEFEHVPTAFIPNFPSLSRPSQPTQYIPPAPSPSRVAFSSLSSRNRRTSRPRTLYLGPGQSLMSNSTRLANARNNRLILPIKPDTPPPEETPNQQQQEQELEEHQPSSSKRIKHNQSDNRTQSAFATPQAPRQERTPLPRQTVDNQALKVLKNHAGTPVRPSPLRNVTLPSVTSSPPRRLASESIISVDPHSQSTTTPKKRKAKASSSIMSSVMKEVNLEMQSRSPVPSPIKPSEIINPYSNLQRPSRHKRPILPPPSKTTSKKDINPDQVENRKRKLQGCLDGTNLDLSGATQDDGKNSNNPMEHILQKTMPQEYREENSSDRPKRKTRQVGKLPERLLKKQKLREEMKKSQEPDQSTKLNSNQPKETSTTLNPFATVSSKPSRPSHVEEDAMAIEKGPQTMSVLSQNRSPSANKASTKLGRFGSATNEPSAPSTIVGRTPPLGSSSSPFNPAPSSATVPPQDTSSSSSSPFFGALSGSTKSSFLGSGNPFARPTPSFTLTSPQPSNPFGAEKPKQSSMIPSAGDQSNLQQQQPQQQQPKETVLEFDDQYVLNSFDRDLLQNFFPSSLAPKNSDAQDNEVKNLVLGFKVDQLASFVLS